MTREYYISIRNVNQFPIVYEYYKEHFDEKKHSPFLDPERFSQFFRLWPLAQDALHIALSHYDIKFEVMKITNVKTGAEIGIR
jgi:hypothetical protein